ncbi:MAG: NAD(P)H-hydrate dehydratase [Magnetococcales bacterium]|nr:NAD(P)H-hydrate dehydratase [Magnetococcales bacterium]
MAKLLTSAQMSQADQRTIEELGLPGVVLMENAGRGCVDVLWSRVSDLRQRRVLVLAGAGNNGGDGFVIARHLLQAGVRVSALLFGQGEQLKGDAAINYTVFVGLGGRVRSVTCPDDLKGFNHQLSHASIVVDAVFGTGLARDVGGVFADVFERVNRAGRMVLAVDIPSGISSDSGALLGVALRADWTVTFAAEKIGHRVQPGAGYCGEVICVPIGIPDHYIDRPEHNTARNVMDDLVIPNRESDAHKGRFGHLLVVAGSVGKGGAAVLTALGAQRCGPGLVTVASPASAQIQIAGQLTEAMTLPLPEQNGVLSKEAMATIEASGVKPTALAIGPGLGQSDGARTLLRRLMVHLAIPMVLDADALNLLSQEKSGPGSCLRARNGPTVLTPHPGEMARLLGSTVAEVQDHRIDITRKAAKDWQVWMVLKGSGSIIAAPDGQVWINETGNNGLAAGGSGDLLTGIIAGLLTQGWSLASATRAGVWLHGKAADLAVENGGGEAGLMARDLLPEIWTLRNQFAT